LFGRTDRFSQSRKCLVSHQTPIIYQVASIYKTRIV
jgi:hypothetical protein